MTDLNNTYQPREHEQLFAVRPVGVKYICEFCNNGEMIADFSEPVNLTDPPMIKHICSECGKSLLLPRTYPYINWVYD